MKNLIKEQLEDIKNENLCKHFRDNLLKRQFKFYCLDNRNFFTLKPFAIGFLRVGPRKNFCHFMFHTFSSCTNAEVKTNLQEVTLRVCSYYEIKNLVNSIHGFFENDKFNIESYYNKNISAFQKCYVYNGETGEEVGDITFIKN